MLSSYGKGECYLSTCLQRNTLQLWTSRINGINKVSEQRDVLLLQDLEVVGVRVRGEERVRDLGAELAQNIHNLLNGIEEVYGNKLDSVVGPGDWQWPSGCHDDLAPASVSIQVCV